MKIIHKLAGVLKSIFQLFYKSGQEFNDTQNKLINISGDKGIRLRAKKYKIFFARYGKGVTIDTGCFFTEPQNIVLEDDVRINRGCKIYGSGGVYIGRHTRIGLNVFINSANHKSNKTGTPQHQSGHEIEKVSIGDGTLISENVSVLPGAIIGKECFFGAGSVVTNKKYTEMCRYAGNPAVEIKSRNSPVEEIVFKDRRVGLLVPDGDYWREFGQVLLSNIGVHQIELISSLENTDEFVLFFALGFQSGEISTKKPVYYLTQIQSNKTQSIVFDLAPPQTKAKSSAIHWVMNSLHYAVNRYEKKAGSYTIEEKMDLALVWDLLAKYQDRISERLRVRLYKLRHKGGNVLFKKLILKKNTNIEEIELLAGLCGDLDLRKAGKYNSRIAAVKKVIEHLKHSFTEDFDLGKEFNNKIFNHDRCAFISLINSSQLNQSISLSLLFSIAADFTKAFPETLKITKILCPSRLEQRGEIHSDIESDIRTLEKIFISTPKIDAKWHLTSQSYENYFNKIINEIRTVIRDVFRRHSLPFVQINPWPDGYEFCFSIRYDVDRPVSISRFNEVVDVQRDLNASCGSWFFREKVKLDFEVGKELEKRGQESGVHLETGQELIDKKGVTSHSAPSSIYWKGTETYTDCIGSPLYIESLHCDSDHGIFLTKKQNGKIRGGLFSTPLHIPLEGTTTDKNLNYLNKYKEFANRKIKNNGLVIIGSHPDLNQDLLKDAVSELGLSQGWMVTIEQAVERINSIYAYQNVQCWENNGKLVLLAKRTIHDLVIYVNDTRHACSLLANVPKIVDLKIKI